MSIFEKSKISVDSRKLKMQNKNFTNISPIAKKGDTFKKMWRRYKKC